MQSKQRSIWIYTPVSSQKQTNPKSKQKIESSEFFGCNSPGNHHWRVCVNYVQSNEKTTSNLANCSNDSDQFVWPIKWKEFDKRINSQYAVSGSSADRRILSDSVTTQCLLPVSTFLSSDYLQILLLHVNQSLVSIRSIRSFRRTVVPLYLQRPEQISQTNSGNNQQDCLGQNQLCSSISFFRITLDSKSHPLTSRY